MDVRISAPCAASTCLFTHVTNPKFVLVLGGGSLLCVQLPPKTMAGGIAIEGDDAALVPTTLVALTVKV